MHIEIEVFERSFGEFVVVWRQDGLVYEHKTVFSSHAKASAFWEKLTNSRFKNRVKFDDIINSPKWELHPVAVTSGKKVEQ